MSEILTVVTFSREKLLFQFLRTSKILRILKLSVYINVVSLPNSPEQSELLQIFEKIVKFYNLGKQSFETDLSLHK